MAGTTALPPCDLGVLNEPRHSRFLAAPTHSKAAMEKFALAAGVAGAMYVCHVLGRKRREDDEAVWQARCELAAAYRACANLGLNESVTNHLTLSLPGRPGHFLVNAFGTAWDEVTASNLLEVDEDGTVIVGEGEPAFGRHGATAALGTAIGVHSMMHVKGGAARAAIFHTHQNYATALACRSRGNRLVMCSQAALHSIGHSTA